MYHIGLQQVLQEKAFDSSHLIYHIFCISIGLVRDNVKGSLSEEICLPLYSILLSIGNPTVDYFSLDVEGAEMGILESIPWDKVDIRVRIANIRFLKTSYRLNEFHYLSEIKSNTQPQKNGFSRFRSYLSKFNI